MKKNKRSRIKRFVISRLNITLIIISLTMALGLYLYRQAVVQPLQIAEVANSSGTVALSLAGTSPNLLPNQTYELDLDYNSPTEHVTSVQARLTYDPEYLEIVSVTKGEQFPLSIESFKTLDGVLSFTFGTSIESGGVTGSGTFAVIKVKTLKTGTTSLTFTDQTMASVTERIGPTDNALQTVASPTFTIANPTDSSPSPSPSASTSVSPSPSPSPSQPSASKPAKPTNLRYNCYEGGTKITLRWDSVSGVGSYELVLDQVDGNLDTYKTLSGTELNLDIASRTKYNWSLRSLKDGVKSDEARINDIVCSGSTSGTASVAPSPSPTSKAVATPAPTKKPSLISKIVQNVVKPTPTPTPTPRPTTNLSSDSTITVEPSPIGGLNDIFTDPIDDQAEPTSSDPGFFSKILLGWQAIFLRLFGNFPN